MFDLVFELIVDLMYVYVQHHLIDSNENKKKVFLFPGQIIQYIQSH